MPASRIQTLRSLLPSPDARRRGAPRPLSSPLPSPDTRRRRPLSSLRTLRSSPAARRGALLGAAITLLSGLAVLGDLLSPALRDRHPMALVLLTPRTPYLVAAADEVPFAVFLVAAVVRLCAADPLHFMLGRTTGPAGMAAAGRVTRRVGTGRRGRLLQGAVARARSSGSSPLWLAGVAVSPTSKSMLVTGAAGVGARRVACADLAGTLLRVVVIWHLGRSFPVLAQRCAALVPWLLVPSGAAAVTLGALRWRRRRPDAGEAAQAGDRCHSGTTPRRAALASSASPG